MTRLLEQLAWLLCVVLLLLVVVLYLGLCVLGLLADALVDARELARRGVERIAGWGAARRPFR